MPCSHFQNSTNALPLSQGVKFVRVARQLRNLGIDADSTRLIEAVHRADGNRDKALDLLLNAA